MEIQIIQNFERMNCSQCGIVFWVPQDFYDECFNNGQDWKCPNGHTRVFSKPQVEILQKEIDWLKKELLQVKSNNIELQVGFDNREKELVKLRKGKQKGVVKS